VSPQYNSIPDPFTGLRNESEISNYTIELADRIGDLMDMSQFPLVLGGDCGILLGSALALKRRGRFGLLFIDGHTDLLTPATSPTGGVAGMDLAIVTGTGPTDLPSIEGLIPYFQPEDVALLGFRWPVPGDGSTAQPQLPMSSFPFPIPCSTILTNAIAL